MKAKCPVCGSEMNIIIKDDDIPYFGKILIMTAVCKNCGYKHSDVFSLEVKEPIKVEFSVEREDDLMVRVVKSSEASVEIPELGVRIDPGQMSDGYVTNVEGILLRIEEVLKGQLVVLEDRKKREKIVELLKKIEKMREGKEKFRIIIEDMSGNSDIISEKTKRIQIKKKEIS